jgi:predicted glycoside hydrolase/deacetylase ChbG (UPF0249 family)
VKRLIVNADDLGRTPGINAGVVEAHLQGIVTSSTVMVLEPAAAQGVADAIHSAPRLSLGLHFALTGGGLPASTPDRVRSLLAEGRFRRFPSDLPEALAPDEVARELEGQISLFQKMAGHPPTHLDSHHHSALHPSVQPVFAEAARRLGIPVRASTVAARDALRGRSVRTPDRFVDGFYGAGATAENLRSIITGLVDEVTELMCHPGHVDRGLLSASTYSRERERELAVLCDPGLKALLVEQSVRLVSFREL